MNLPDAVEKVGCTYRQADYWLSRGHLKAAGQGRGQGQAREISPVELRVMWVYARLADAGLSHFIADAAHRIRPPVIAGIVDVVRVSCGPVCVSIDMTRAPTPT